jgi:hypothetical protein
MFTVFGLVLGNLIVLSVDLMQLKALTLRRSTVIKALEGAMKLKGKLYA